MKNILKQSTATVISFGPFLDKTDGVTLETGLVSALDHATTGIMLSKNGGTLAVRHATVTASTYDAHGCYRVTLDATDTGTLGTLRAIYTDPATCLPVWQDYAVVPAHVYDGLVAGSDLLQVDAQQIRGTDQTARDLGASVLVSVGTGAGQINASGGKVPATLAAGDVTGNVPADAKAWNGGALPTIPGAPLDAAGTRAALGLASANLDGQLSDIHTHVDNVDTNTQAIGDALPVLQAAILSAVDGVPAAEGARVLEGTLTVDGARRILLSGTAGDERPTANPNEVEYLGLDGATVRIRGTADDTGRAVSLRNGA